MSVKKRNVIIFQHPSYESKIDEDLSCYDWKVFVANNTDQAANILSNHDILVGLCLLGQCHDNDFRRDLSRLFYSFSQLNWIMGLPKECMPEVLPSSFESKLITEYCYDYLTIPIEMDRLVFALGHAHGMAEIAASTKKGFAEYASSYGIIGSSPVMLEFFRRLEKTYQEDCSVLIKGETGTGKELVANAIHHHSSRAGNPLVALNCGAFPKDLIQAELFGYEKGAFTGAQQQKIGRIESAQGGTLFLDEIGDLPLDQQVNLLRFLEERVIVRIGGVAKIPVNVRIIAATHVNLQEAVQKGAFREDLYYRLRELVLKTPPLRERDGDIEQLAWYYFNKFTANQNKYKAKGFNSDALFVLKNHHWPGNVRELINCIRDAVIMSENRLLTAEDLKLERRTKDRILRPLAEARALSDRDMIVASLYQSNNNVSRAAELLGISRVSLHRLIDKYQLKCGTTTCSLCPDRNRCRWAQGLF